MLIIGIDPGKTGAIADIQVTVERVTVNVAKMPGTANNLGELLRQLKSKDEDVKVYLELVRATQVKGKDGQRRPMGATAAFTFGQGFGRLEGAIAALGLPCQQITPTDWQKALGKKFKGDKSALLAEAQRLYPGVRIAKYQADGVLIAHVGWVLEAERRKAAG